MGTGQAEDVEDASTALLRQLATDLLTPSPDMLETEQVFTSAESTLHTTMLQAFLADCKQSLEGHRALPPSEMLRRPVRAQRLRSTHHGRQVVPCQQEPPRYVVNAHRRLSCASKLDLLLLVSLLCGT